MAYINRTVFHTISLVVSGLVALAATGDLHAQSRKRVTITGPRTVGRGTSGRSFSDFRAYSAGVGSLTQSRPLDRGALHTSMSAGRGNSLNMTIRQQQYNPQAAPVRAIGDTTRSIRRTPGAQPTGTGITNIPGPSVGPARTSRSTKTYNPGISSPAYLEDTTGLPFPAAPANLIADYDVTDPRVTILRQLSATRSTMSHVTALTSLDDERRPKRPVKQVDGEGVTSLAPAQPGLYRSFMQRGEERFREGEYQDAETAFSSAVDISGRSSEALVSLSRARLAAGQYDLAGMNLAEVLTSLPELPLSDIDPQNFYDEPEAYHKHVAALNDEVAAEPWRAHRNLLLGYHLYRSGEMKQVQEPLSRALATAQADKNEDLEDAILILWDAMRIKGIADQPLVPAELPSANAADDGTADEAGSTGDATDQR